MSDLALDTSFSAATTRVADARLRMAESLGRLTDARDPALRRQAASRLMSELFFKPILAEMREFPFGRELITDGWAGSAFDERLDERIADAVSGASHGLVSRIASDLDPGSHAAAPFAPGAEQARWPLHHMLATQRESQP